MSWGSVCVILNPRLEVRANKDRFRGGETKTEIVPGSTKEKFRAEVRGMEMGGLGPRETQRGRSQNTCGYCKQPRLCHHNEVSRKTHLEGIKVEVTNELSEGWLRVDL